MRIWVEYLTPKQMLFYKPLIDELKGRGWNALVTTRRYRETDALARIVGVEAQAVGKHGGGSLRGKLACSINRMKKLIRLVDRFKPKVALSTSPDAARVSFGLGIPHLLANDSPHSAAVAKLTVPLSFKLLTPWIIPVEEWTKYGIEEKNVVRYRALDPVMWLKHMSVEDGTPFRWKMHFKQLIIVRVEEVHASYMMFDKPTLIEDSIHSLSVRVPDALILVMPRYGWQMKYLNQRFKRLKNVVVLRKPVYAPSILSRATLFVGSGGTMTCEAALMGTPAISYYPRDDLYVERYLINFGLISKAKAEELVDVVLSTLSNIDYVKCKNQELSKKLWNLMEDPMSRIIEVIERVASNV
ncbi:MAG: DUF354 domain-containing protein [Candidatus Nezhaarchaeota archaeon]|nr:DUF354 domain-containing protein [Candidatus Nezhaarchaeota archaeon]